MGKGLIIVLVIIGIVILGISWGVGIYNNVIKLEVEVDVKWAQIDNQLLRRSDLVPDLVRVANKYASTEKEIIQGVADARSKLAGAGTVQEKNAANNELDSALSRLLVVVENYPNLKSNEQYTRVMDEMAGTENRLAVARMDYNEAVKTFNVKIKTFPTALFRGIMGVEEKVFFEVPAESRQKPEYDL